MIKNILYRLSFLFFLYLVFYFCLDGVLRLAAVWAAQSALGAKVEIGRLRTGLFPPRLELLKAAAADPSRPMKNLFEFEKASFRLEGRPLLERKFIVSEASVTGIRVGSDRKSSGALPKKAAPSWAAPGAEILEKTKTRASQFTLEKVSQVKEGIGGKIEIKKEDLKSLALLEEIKGRYGKSLGDWEKVFEEAGLEKKTEDLQKRFKSLKSGSNVLAQVRQFQELAEEAKKLTQEAGGLETKIRQDFSRFQEDLRSVEAARKKDAEELMSRLSLPRLDSESLSNFLLGPEMSSKAAFALNWISWARAHMGSSSKPPAPKRGEGLTVPFKSFRSYPSWAVREAKLSGLFPLADGEHLAWEGKAAGVTSRPDLLGQPAEIELRGAATGPGKPEVFLRALLDHRKEAASRDQEDAALSRGIAREAASDRLEFHYKGMRVGPVRLGRRDSIELQVSSGSADLKGDISLEGESLRGRISFAERGISVAAGLGPEGGGDLVRRVAEGALRGLSRLEAELELKGTLKNPEWSLDSSLGRAFSEGLKKSLGKEAEAQRKALEAKVQSLVSAQTETIRKDLEEKKGKMLSRISSQYDLLKEVQKPPVSKPDLKKWFQ